MDANLLLGCARLKCHISSSDFFDAQSRVLQIGGPLLSGLYYLEKHPLITPWRGPLPDDEGLETHLTSFGLSGIGLRSGA